MLYLSGRFNMKKPKRYNIQCIELDELSPDFDLYNLFWFYDLFRYDHGHSVLINSIDLLNILKGFLDDSRNVLNHSECRIFDKILVENLITRLKKYDSTKPMFQIVLSKLGYDK